LCHSPRCPFLISSPRAFFRSGIYEGNLTDYGSPPPSGYVPLSTPFSSRGPRFHAAEAQTFSQTITGTVPLFLFFLDSLPLSPFPYSATRMTQSYFYLDFPPSSEFSPSARQTSVLFPLPHFFFVDEFAIPLVAGAFVCNRSVLHRLSRPKCFSNRCNSPFSLSPPPILNCERGSSSWPSILEKIFYPTA